MRPEHNRIDGILEGIDTGLQEASRLYTPDSVAAIEGQAWMTIYESYEAGWIDTIEEAEDKFAEWRRVWQLGRQGCKHVW